MKYKYKIGDAFRCRDSTDYISDVRDFLKFNNLVILDYYDEEDNEEHKKYASNIPTNAGTFYVFDESDITKYFIKINSLNKLKKLLKGDTK